MDAVAAETQKHERRLDRVVRYRFGGDPDVMAALESSCNTANPTRGKVTPPEVSDGLLAASARGTATCACGHGLRG